MIPAPTVRNLADVVLASIILTAGLAALVAMLARRRVKDKALLWFGIFAVMYGVRQLARDPLVRMALGAMPGRGGFFAAWFDFAIAVPVMLFSEEYFGRGWRSSMRWAVWFSAVYAVAGIAAGLTTGDPYALPEPGSGVIWLLWLGVAVAALVGRYRPPPMPDAALFGGGAAVFLLSVLDEHLAPERYHAEPLGLFVFIVCLGVITARRVQRNEQRLVAVEEEMASARRIQASILPDRAPQMAGVRIAARYLPMASVAGDFYDFVRMDANRAGILIADVAGHGVPAALVSSMVKVALASQHTHARAPGHVLAGLNQIFCQQRTGKFITGGYLYIDSAAPSAVYSGAAHPPLILFRRSEMLVQRFENNGLFLGFRENESYPEIDIPVRPGDRLLLYSDGLLEASNSKGEPFEVRIDDCIVKHSHLGAEEFADALLADLTAWSARKGEYSQEDDLSLVVVDLGLGERTK